ncbi:hypothetical protein NQ036_06885 [Brevibacterium sp. 91QC2O2]|uniref:helix-turn-helix domain-containing protein n=1 Tax=Brevibacterium sp. 91QC2O2 TaxID=2968458 RepID=UPI00211BB4A4|nr:hypothetical protein [Brevibacterium sp. 91QC2O2]MCQ9367969.1 hypothetical protein [Brevibacterium sp. 91QC2O2]
MRHHRTMYPQAYIQPDQNGFDQVRFRRYAPKAHRRLMAARRTHERQEGAKMRAMRQRLGISHAELHIVTGLTQHELRKAEKGHYAGVIWHGLPGRTSISYTVAYNMGIGLIIGSRHRARRSSHADD